MTPGAPLKQSGSAPATPSLGPIVHTLCKGCVHKTPRRGLVKGCGLAPRIAIVAGTPSAKRPSIAASAAVTAGGAFPEDGRPFAPLKRFTQQLVYDKYDKEIWGVALPALVAMLLEPALGAINAGLVGHLGTLQLSALSLGSLAVTLCTFFYTFLLFLTVPEIAAAVVRKDDDEVSCVAAKSLWIAVVCGVVSAGALYRGAESIVGMLKPPEPAVAAFAIDYIKVRSLGIPAVLLGFVSTGVFRGFKDTRTPLLAAVVSAAVSLGLNVLLLYVLGLGVVGSAVATMGAQVVSCGLLLGALLGGGRVQPRHLSRPPPLAAMVPTLKLGALLGARNIVSFGMVLYASALSIRLGSAYQASFEVLRQVWLLAIQFFECLNVATQALCASYLGKEDRVTARALLDRLLVLGVVVGALVGAAVWAARGPLIAFFSSDRAVRDNVLTALPMICAFFPIDAAAAIMDGSLLAAKQSNYMSAVQIAGSFVQYGVMLYLAATGNITTLNVWSALKILIVLRVAGGVARNYFSPKSGYTPLPEVAATPAAAAEPLAQPAAAGAAEMTTAAAAAAAEPARPPLQLPLPAATAAAVAVQERAAALQSIEDDAMVLAAAAAASATDMNPDMLSFKQRQTAPAAALAPAASASASTINGANGDANGANGGGAAGVPAAATAAATSSTAGSPSPAAG